MKRDPEELIDLTRSGDGEALDELIGRCLPGLRVFARLRMSRALRAKESATDIAQSVCRELLERLEGFDYRDEKSFRKWLYNAAVHKISHRERHYMAQRRDVKREIPPEQQESGARSLLECYATLHTPSRNAIASEELARIEDAFDRMPEDYREVIVLTRVLRLSHAEVAAEMGRNEGAVRVLLHRAMARLATLLSSQPD